jgi:membrane associated rhomboid family serine protease
MLPISDEVEYKRRTPVATTALALLLLGVTLAVAGPEQGSQLAQVTREWGLVPSQFLADATASWHRLFTATLLHGSVLHLGVNLLFLWVFGRGLEHELGAWFLPFYFTCGVVGGLASVLVRPSSDVPGIGASGAISGLMGAYLVLMPHATLRAIVLVPWLFVVALLRGDRPIWDVPAWTGILTWFGLQLLYLAAPAAVRSNIDYAAHVGGFLAGYAMIRFARAVFGLWPDEPAYQRLLDRPTAQGAPRPISFVRATRLIPIGKVIEDADLEWVDRGSAYVDPDVVPGRDGRQLVGRRMRHARYRYEPIRWDDLEPVAQKEQLSAPR